MRIPFVQHNGVGIHITNEKIRWVELSRISSRIRIERFDSEKVEDGNSKKALQRLVGRLQPRDPFVAVNVSSPDCIISAAEVPFLDDPEYLQEWLDETARELIPQDMSPEQVVISHQLYGDPDLGQHCLFLIADKESVQKRVALLESTGLQPLCMSSGDLEAGYTLLFDQQHASGSTWVLRAFEDHGCLIKYSDGFLDKYIPLPRDLQTTEEIIAEAESVVRSHVAPSTSTEVDNMILCLLSDTINQKVVIQEGFREVSPLAHLSCDGEAIPSDYGIAAGLALSQMYPDPERINLIGQESVERCRRAIEKKDAKKLAYVCVSIIGGLLLILSLFQYYLSSRASQVDSEASRLEDKIAAVSDAQDQIKALKRSVINTRTEVLNRTHSAKLLEAVGRTVPGNLWLSELKMEVSSDSAEVAILSLHGMAAGEALLAEFLDQLEQTKGVNRVHLELSERVMTEQLYEDARLNPKQLTLFEINLKAATYWKRDL